ncbi:DUF4158 domain-containing protein [Streptomyces ardesiacus]|uniref:DUF4158 domain-containing protein n=1 Tax=Streptomyces ardesiacus TaxID=285564 RepID=UPI00380E1F96
MASIERTAYPRFKRLINAHELHLFFSPTRDELEWAAGATDGDEHLPALLLMLKSYQRMGCFSALEDVPEQVVEFVRRHTLTSLRPGGQNPRRTLQFARGRPADQRGWRGAASTSPSTFSSVTRASSCLRVSSMPW